MAVTLGHPWRRQQLRTRDTPGQYSRKPLRRATCVWRASASRVRARWRSDFRDRPAPRPVSALDHGRGPASSSRTARPPGCRHSHCSRRSWREHRFHPRSQIRLPPLSVDWVDAIRGAPSSRQGHVRQVPSCKRTWTATRTGPERGWASTTRAGRAARAQSIATLSSRDAAHSSSGDDRVKDRTTLRAPLTEDTLRCKCGREGAILSMPRATLRFFDVSTKFVLPLTPIG